MAWHDAPTIPDQQWFFQSRFFERISGWKLALARRELRSYRYDEVITREFANWVIEVLWSRPWNVWDHMDAVYQHWLFWNHQSDLEELANTDLIDPKFRSTRPYVSLFEEFCKKERAA